MRTDYLNFGNAILSMISPQGLVTLKPNADIPFAFLMYLNAAVEHSCGRCTPCRVGMPILRDLMQKIADGRSDEVDFKFMLDVAELMRDTSFCGVGKTVPLPLIEALKQRPEEFKKKRSTAPLYGHFELMTAPCIEACPAHVDVPKYIDYLRQGEPDLAAGVILRHYPLMGSCGRVCVRLCEKACRRKNLEGPVDIKNLKRYAHDALGQTPDTLFKGAKVEAGDEAPRVAVVGAGPAGLTCAYHLLLKGYKVDLYEALQKAGGMALTGIPSYRLPKEVLQNEVHVVQELGGQFHFGRKLGASFCLDDLFADGANAVFIAVGCSKGNMLGFKEDQEGIQGYTNGLDFLLRASEHAAGSKPMPFSGDTVVVGGGNVAMDCARTAVRMQGGKVHVVYRRTEEQAPADKEEIRAAKEEGIEFHFLTAQKRLVVQDGKVTGIVCAKLKDAGNRKLVEIEGSEFVIACENLISAIGQKIDQSIFADLDGILFDKRGNISVTDALATTRPGVFAGGDCATGPTTLIGGMAQGQRAAESIHEYLTRGSVGFEPRRRVSEIIEALGLIKDVEPCEPQLHNERAVLKELDPVLRSRSFDEVELGLSEEAALKEASRCMRCYRLVSVVTQLPIPGTATR